MRRALSVIHGPVFGGGNNQTMLLAEPLRRHGWESLAMVPDLPEARPTLERMRAGGLPTGMVELHRLRRTPDPRVQAAFLASFRREVARLRGLIRRERIDLVQAFGDTNPHLAIAGHLERTAVVWQLYDTVTPPAVRPFTMRLVTSIADVVMTTGRGLARAYPGAEGLGERCITVYPPVDTARFAPDPERRARAREALGLPGDALVVGTVGNRNPTKGHDVLAEAVGLLHSRGRDVWCRVLGARSPAHADHMAAVETRVAELGLGDRLAFRDPGDDVAALMPAFDVFVISSVPRSEGVPTVILEAMACGLPVVSTDVGAVSEVVEEGVTGHVVPPVAPERLADALDGLLGDQALRTAYGHAARDHVLARYSIERCVETYVAGYELAVRFRMDRHAERR
jgi:glycosyltransferase involved in cell wall biosynthesis